jgi:hypothetical protein
MSNENAFTLSSLLVLSWAYFNNLFEYIKNKTKSVNKKIDFYKSISIKSNLYNDYEKLSKSIKDKKSFLTDSNLNIIFYIIKLFIYTLIVLFFNNFGGKLDNSSELDWVLLFIPVYMISIPLIIFAILHSYTNIKKSYYVNIITTIFSIGIVN